ncbi:hypothetical protein CBW65_06955 [Tumebacillus avium]|uniref:Uncharacterized protein n=1 Tax=Tumebacillus avium TaxID=1903704 RepID=A0A1Y0INE1_9BACL|nr:hypothetical protein [Tumebacillus avium]ARU60864.1 hypothetical protein CBW65_06955 [Tumebacillus avium]
MLRLVRYVLFGILLLPIVTYGAVKVANSDPQTWMGFFGSYYGGIIGGVISGLITFLGVKATIKNEEKKRFMESYWGKKEILNQSKDAILHFISSYNLPLLFGVQHSRQLLDTCIEFYDSEFHEVVATISNEFPHYNSKVMPLKLLGKSGKHYATLHKIRINRGGAIPQSEITVMLNSAEYEDKAQRCLKLIEDIAEKHNQEYKKFQNQDWFDLFLSKWKKFEDEIDSDLNH